MVKNTQRTFSFLLHYTLQVHFCLPLLKFVTAIWCTLFMCRWWCSSWKLFVCLRECLCVCVWSFHSLSSTSFNYRERERACQVVLGMGKSFGNRVVGLWWMLMAKSMAGLRTDHTHTQPNQIPSAWGPNGIPPLVNANVATGACETRKLTEEIMTRERSWDWITGVWRSSAENMHSFANCRKLIFN